MPFTMTNTVRKVRDHFEPEANLDPQQQRALRAAAEIGRASCRERVYHPV